MKEQDGICLRKSINTFSIHLYKNGKEEVEKIAKACNSLHHTKLLMYRPGSIGK